MNMYCECHSWVENCAGRTVSIRLNHWINWAKNGRESETGVREYSKSIYCRLVGFVRLSRFLCELFEWFFLNYFHSEFIDAEFRQYDRMVIAGTTAVNKLSNAIDFWSNDNGASFVDRIGTSTRGAGWKYHLWLSDGSNWLENVLDVSGCPSIGIFSAMHEPFRRLFRICL